MACTVHFFKEQKVVKKANHQIKSAPKVFRKISGKRRIVIGIALFAFLLFWGGFFALNLVRNNTTIIGFYNIPETDIKTIESLIMKDPLYKTKFIVLSEKNALSKRLFRKVDVLVAYNGALTADLAAKAVPLSSAIQVRYPSAIKDSPFFTSLSKSGSMNFCIMPLLLDHFETSYFEVMKKKTGQKYPETLAQLESYAAGCQQYLQNPLICAGAQDANLYSLISVFIESYGGQKGYLNLVQQMKQMKSTERLKQMLSLPVGGDAPNGTTFASVLDRIKQLQKQSLILPEWYKTTEQTVSIAMDDNHAAVVFMSLREHREKPFPAIKYFQGYQFPPETSKTRAVVETALCAMMFRDTEAAQIFMGRLSSEAGQEALSISTKLGPATLRGEAFDVQADDARYFAAATPGGPVPDIGTASFKDKGRRSAIAAEIRTYLAQN